MLDTMGITMKSDNMNLNIIDKSRQMFDWSTHIVDTMDP